MFVKLPCKLMAALQSYEERHEIFYSRNIDGGRDETCNRSLRSHIKRYRPITPSLSLSVSGATATSYLRESEREREGGVREGKTF